jgi:hypothetical protein
MERISNFMNDVLRPSNVSSIRKSNFNVEQKKSLPYFAERRVVVTGASSGIGKAVAIWYSAIQDAQ